MSKLAADFFKSEDDSLALPQVKIVREKSTCLLKVGDNVICEDYESCEKKEAEVCAARRRGKERRELVDTSEVEKFGPSYDELTPSLETLCVRELHKAEREHAIGETGGAATCCKAAVAAAAGKEQGEKAS